MTMQSEDILGEGAPFTAEWVKRSEGIWNSKRKDKTRSIFDRLNYNSLLTEQNPRAPFVVLYNKSGTNLVAAYLTASECQRVGHLPIKGFVADYVTYHFYPESLNHALYLVGVLNSTVVNEAIKPYQSQGLMGERDITRRPFEVCSIPLFDPKDTLHQKIVVVAHEAREKMLEWKSQIAGNAAQAREAGRQIVRSQIKQLDELVRELLKGQVLSSRASRADLPDHPGLFPTPKA